MRERVGAAAGATLYRAVRPESSRQPRVVAIRMADDRHSAAAVERIRIEYDTLEILDDQRIPTVHGHYSGQAALAMSWIDGITLADVIETMREGAIPRDLATLFDVVVEVAHALRHAHNVQRQGARIVHGHLGPQRVRITSTGDVYVVGFGVEPRGMHAAYTPPEQASGAFIDHRADQWALGAMIVELLLGERLYTGAARGLEAAREGKVTPWLTRVRAQWPPLAGLLERMLAPAAGDRFDSESELIRQLQVAAHGFGVRPDRARLYQQVADVVGIPPDSFTPELEVRSPGELPPGNTTPRHASEAEAPAATPPTPPRLETAASKSPDPLQSGGEAAPRRSAARAISPPTLVPGLSPAEADLEDRPTSPGMLDDVDMDGPIAPDRPALAQPLNESRRPRQARVPVEVHVEESSVDLSLDLPLEAEDVPEAETPRPRSPQPGPPQPGQTQPGQTQPGQTQPGQTMPVRHRPILIEGGAASLSIAPTTPSMSPAPAPAGPTWTADPPEAEPGPPERPVQSFQVTEVVGIGMGLLLILVGLSYLFLRFW